MRKIALIFTVLLCSAVNVFSQVQIKGKVTDKAGNGVAGATVKIKGTNKGLSTNSDGTFTLNWKESNPVLEISGIGYLTQTVTVSGSDVNVALEKDTKSLNEVVVTALGISRSKAKLGYATTTVNSEQITRASPANVLDALAGKVAGANISKIGGPGSSTKVILRGYGVISGGTNQPLYVIDGVPFNDARFGASDNVDFGSGLNELNPSDIESITILHGTEATAAYGSAARNGAFMITTKRGRVGKLKVDYSGSVNFSRVGKLPEMQSTFGQGWAGLFVLGENGSWGPKLDGKTRAWGAIVNNSQLLKPFSFIDDNIRDFYNTGIEYNNSVALSGGSDNSQFYFSYGNVTSDGVMPSKTDFYSRNTVALRTNTKFSRFSINSSFNYSNKVENVPFTGQGDAAGGSTFEEILQIPVDLPIKDFKDYHNLYFNVDNYFTPYAENPYYPLYENGNTQNLDRFFGNVDMNYKIVNNLSAELRFGADFANARTFRYKAVNAPSPGSWNAGGNTEGQSRVKDVGTVSEGADYLGSVNGDFILKYTPQLSSAINLETYLGYNYYQEESKSSVATITELLVPGFYNLSNTLAPPTAADAKSKRRRMGVYLQATADYRSQLFLTVNARNDWSSTLPINHNNIFYPGANLAWVASKSFDLAAAKISLLKFRAGYGKTGADPLPYQTNPTLVIGNTALPFGNVTFPFSGVGAYGISNTINNSDLKPIITKEAEIGVDLGFFKNRLEIDLTLYDKRTEGQIFAVPIGPSSGYNFIVKNLGEIQNRGIELTLNAKPIMNKDLRWDITYTYTKQTSKVLDLGVGLDKVIFNTAYDAELVAYPGQSLLGIYAPTPRYTTDGKIIVSSTTGMPLEATDKGKYGTAEYDFMMGLSNTVSYKDFTLNFSFDYRKGGVMYSGTADLLQFTGNAYNTTINDRKPFIIPNSVIEISDPITNKPTYVENTIPIDETAYTDYYYPTQNKAGSYANRIIDKSFLKLRDISLGYNLPKKWAGKINASNISLNVYGRNFLLWTPESNFYMDPELSNLGNDIPGELGEFRTGPSSKQYGVTLRASF